MTLAGVTAVEAGLVTSSTVGKPGFLNPELIFRLSKYTIYALLTYNAILFFNDDFAASAVTFGDTITWRNVIEAYSATIDTTAWILLLLIFELQTAILPDHLLKGGLKWFLKTLSAICYFFIIYAFYGYVSKYLMISQFNVFEIADVCTLIGSEFTYVETLDEYLEINSEVCAAMNGQQLVQIAGENIISTMSAVSDATRLAIVDMINSLDWLIIVFLLEVEVFLQLKDKLTEKRMKAAKYIKGFLYSILFICAAYWGFKGSFLDFWDAFLWLVAFIFIELNIFQWHSETEEEKEQVMKV